MSKRKATPEFLAYRVPHQRQGDADGRLSDQMTAVRLPEPIHEIVSSLPQKSAWLRRVITEAAERELMDGSES
jgi:hypothetical protein